MAREPRARVLRGRAEPRGRGAVGADRGRCECALWRDEEGARAGGEHRASDERFQVRVADLKS